VISGKASLPISSLSGLIVKSRRLIAAMLGSVLHAALPSTMSLAMMRSGHENSNVQLAIDCKAAAGGIADPARNRGAQQVPVEQAGDQKHRQHER
jgi:hypothetical protein